MTLHESVRIEIVPASEHLPGEYAEYFEGHRAVRIFDGNSMLGECVWRYGTGANVEITEFGVFDEGERRLGYGSRLMQAALDDAQAFFESRSKLLLRVFLFCEMRNTAARALYERFGFTLAGEIEHFYGKGFPHAALYVLRCRDVAQP